MAKEHPAPIANNRRPMLTVEELAAYLQVPKQTVYRWNTRGTGPQFRHVGRYVRYHWEDIDKWVETGNRAQ